MPAAAIGAAWSDAPRAFSARARRRVVVIVTVLSLVICYASVLRGMVEQWWNDEDMGHGFLVPIVIAWIIWRDRARWRTLPPQPSWWGLGLLAIAGCVGFLSVVGAGLFACSVALILSVAGAVVGVGGFSYLRAWALPFLLALFMLPKLAIVYNQVTLPLQLLASRLAEGMLLAGGALVTRHGNIIDVGGHSVAVAEACSGIRYLLSLGFVAVVFAYLADAKAWMRFALLAAAVPVAILANAMRVAASAAIPALDAGTPHASTGWLVFVLCVAVLITVRGLLNTAYARYHD